MGLDNIDEIFRIIALSYPAYEFSDEAKDYWAKELMLYDYEEVLSSLKRLKSDERYYKSPPQLEVIVKGLTKIADKVDFTKKTVFCGICRRAFNDIAKCHEHENRCSAIRYIIKQYQRFELGEINNSKKRELYQMSQDAFDEKYNKLLKIVFDRTDKGAEKEIIRNIFKSMGKEEDL